MYGDPPVADAIGRSIVDETSTLRRLEIAESSEKAGWGSLGSCARSSAISASGAKKAHAEAEIKRQWERSGEVGRRGAQTCRSAG
jgi:hypothetical protein